MDFSQVAQSFATHYFMTFDNYDARKSLADLYREESMLTWEGSQTQGKSNILDDLMKPELKALKTIVSKVDAMPSIANTILVCVTGNLAIDNAIDKPLIFTETFLLAPIPGQPGGFYIHNQDFRLIPF